MRVFEPISLAIIVVLIAGCSASTAQPNETTPEPVGTEDSTEAVATESDDTLQRAQAAATAFGEALGPVLTAEPEVRNFEACERANELVMQANALNAVGVPDDVPDDDAYREELARLPTAVNMMATYCGRGVETVPADFWVSAELTYYRLLVQLEPSLRGEPGEDESSQTTAAREVRAALAPVAAAHREDRITTLCQAADSLGTAVAALQTAGTPSGLPGERHYTAELERLTTAAGTAATECSEGINAVSNGLAISILVSAERLWLMLHRRWPGT